MFDLFQGPDQCIRSSDYKERGAVQFKGHGLRTPVVPVQYRSHQSTAG